jgi:hypothetical protein
MKLYLLLIMIFLHIVDDYYLQGFLASLKQKRWWEKNAPDKLYRKDYIMALLEHAFSWTFMIMITPVIYIYINKSPMPIDYTLPTFIYNWLIHAYVDNLKANNHKINLIQDQSIHLVQIIITWALFIA